MATTFRLQGGLGDNLGGLTLGPWVAEPTRTVVSASAGEPLSFLASADDPAPAQQAPRWCVDIDQSDIASLAAVHRAFDDGERSVRRTHAKLDDALARIDHAIEHGLGAARGSGGSAGSGPLTFYSGGVDDYQSGSNLSRAEMDLVDDLRTIQGYRAPVAGTSGPLSFAGPDDPDEMDPETRKSRWRSLAEGARSAIDRVTRVATYPSWVETRVAGRLVARSAVSWTGDTENLASRRLSPELIAVHTRSVSISLRTRNAWSRLLITVVHGSTKLAAVTGTSGALMAVPMAWKFVRRIIADVDELRAIRQ